MLKLLENNKNLGTLHYGVTHTFYVKVQNPTGNDIVISSLQVGCGRCTVASIPSGVVKANSTELMKVDYTPNSTGYTPKTITINQHLVFNFSAQVVN